MLKAIPIEINNAIKHAKDRLPGAILIVKHLYRQSGEVCSLNKDAAMKIYRKDDGWYFHCFRCAYQGFIADDTQSPEELKARWLALQAKKSSESLEQITLPEDYKIMKQSSSYAPTEAWHWLWKYQISEATCQKYKIGWSDTYQRVILPCYRTAMLKPSNDYAYKLLGWSAREVFCKTKEERKEKGVMKYLTKKSSHVKHLFFHVPMNTERIVLVEDILSAIKIAEMGGLSSIALLTTYIPPALMLKLRNHKITIWLDDNMESKMVNYVSLYGQRGFDVSRILTDKDPKAHTYGEIQNILNPIAGGNND